MISQNICGFKRDNDTICRRKKGKDGGNCWQHIIQGTKADMILIDDPIEEISWFQKLKNKFSR